MLEKFWWVIVAVVVLTVLVFVMLRVKRERANQKEIDGIRQDESIMLNVYNRMNSFDYREYKGLPGREARLEWLWSLYPEFMEAVARRYSNSDYDFAVAKYLDVRIFRDETVPSKDAIRIYRNTAIAMSLNDYQVILDAKNKEHYLKRQELAKQEAQREADKAAELARQKKVAKRYWKSLSPDQKARFKDAKGKAARKNVLPASFSEYSLDVLYPIIMATQFSNVSDSHQSISHCESTGHGSSFGDSFGHFDGGSHTTFDGGSHTSFDGGSSFSSDSGGVC